LVVIIILTTVVAAAIPILSPANDARRIREAGRGLNTFITGAQSRAVSLNRPFGIALKRLSQDTNTDPNKRTNASADIHEDNGVCLEVFYVEQLPPYSGFDANSRACVALLPDNPELVVIRFITRGVTGTDMPRGWQRDEFPTATIRPGDVIEIAGTRYELVPTTPLNDPDNYSEIGLDELGYFTELNQTNVPAILGRPLNDSGQQLNVRHDDRGLEMASLTGSANRPFWTGPVTYKILRQATPTSDEPYQLPEGVAIDLRASGVGNNLDYFYLPNEVDNSLGVIIMFTPEGRVARVQYSEMPFHAVPFDQPVTDSIYLLLGKRENIPAPLDDDDITLSSDFGTLNTEEKRAEAKAGINWLSGDATWVVIGSQSGRVATVENAAVDPLTVINDTSAFPPSAPESDELMRTRQILAAREFTRETSQIGGR
jgi:hypothetical protein